jgi:hypothetical protein
MVRLGQRTDKERPEARGSSPQDALQRLALGLKELA